MKFLTLKTTEGEELTINVNHIVSITSSKGNPNSTDLVMSEGTKGFTVPYSHNDIVVALGLDNIINMDHFENYEAKRQAQSERNANMMQSFDRSYRRKSRI